MHHPVNFRDVAEALELIQGRSPIQRGALLRGGKFDELTSVEELGNPRTVLNLRRGPDSTHLEGVVLMHVPAEDSVENYDTQNGKVRRWLRAAISAVADASMPVYVHCTSGKDRTGVLIAAILHKLGVDRHVVLEEYDLSSGAERVHIVRALDGLGSFDVPERTLKQLRDKLLV